MSNLVPIGKEVPQDWHKLRSHLKEHNLDLSEGSTPRQFASGFGNLNYLLQIDGTSYVLRRPPLGPIPPGANDMNRENRILSRLNKEYPLAPKAIHFCGDEEILGAPFFIMEYRPGIVIGGNMPEELQGWKDKDGRPIGAFVGENLIDSLAAFHRVKPDDVDLDTLGRPEGFNARTVKGWMHRVELAWNGPLPAVALKIGEWLRENTPEDDAPSLIHNDFKLDNMILDQETLNPIAVIDWDMGTQGSPLFDLCVTLSYWTEPSDPQVMRDLNQMPTDGFGFMSRKDAAARYAKQTGLDLENITFFRVLAMLRLAGIFVQLNHRYREGGSTDERFATFDKLAEELLDFALEIINGKYF